jgi:hypothetical protein
MLQKTFSQHGSLLDISTAGKVLRFSIETCWFVVNFP